MPEISALEIKALVRILDELSYYQILHVEPTATRREIKQAYYENARTYHPDANRHLEVEMQHSCLLVSKCITEAYCVLRDPRKRKSYDEKLAGGESMRIQLSEAKSAHAKRDSAERTGHTPQGKQFLHKAREEMDRGECGAAIGHLQMALTFEPSNDYFKELLEEARKQRG